MFKHIIDNDIELRLVDIHHAEEMFKSIDSNREHLGKYLPWVDSTETVEDTISFIKNSKKKYAANDGFDASIWYKGEFAGVIGFHGINPSIKEISIGYWLDENYVGKGIMTKACIEFINYAFTIYNLNRVVIRCAEDNLKSRAIPERLGFTKEGIIRDGELLKDGYVNCVIYGMLRKEWNRGY